MNPDQEFSTSIQDLFDSLKVKEWGYFRRLWKEGKLSVRGSNLEKIPFDFIDEYCARLVCQTLLNKDRILVVTPDQNISRRSAMIVSAALQTFDKHKVTDSEAGNVVYFGTSVGIRQHLENVFIDGKGLKNFFDTSVGRSAHNLKSVGKSIPKLNCIFTPIDATEVLQKLNPEWIAIDCDDSEELPWLESVLAKAV